jgi:hypothetical protein
MKQWYCQVAGAAAAAAEAAACHGLSTHCVRQWFSHLAWKLCNTQQLLPRTPSTAAKECQSLVLMVFQKLLAN